MKDFLLFRLFLPRKFHFKQNVNGLKKTDTTTSYWNIKQKKRTHYIGRENKRRPISRERFIFSSIDIAIFLFQFFNSVYRCWNEPPSPSNSSNYRIFDLQPHFRCIVISYNIKYRLVREMCLCIDRRNMHKNSAHMYYTLYCYYTLKPNSFDCRCSFTTNILQFR